MSDMEIPVEQPSDGFETRFGKRATCYVARIVGPDVTYGLAHKVERG